MAEQKAQRKKEQSSPDSSSTASQGGLLEQARDVASQVADQAKGAVGSRMIERTTASAVQLSEIADALRHTSIRLEGNIAAPWVQRAAARVESISDALDHADVRQVVKNIERFARREPVLFLGGAFAVGVLGARFLRGAASAANPSGGSEQAQLLSGAGREVAPVGRPGRLPS